MRVWVKELEVVGMKRVICSNGIVDAAISAVAQVCSSPPSVSDLAALCQRPAMRCPKAQHPPVSTGSKESAMHVDTG